MDIIFEQEIPLEKSLILFANYFQFDFGIRLVFHKTSGSGQEIHGPIHDGPVIPKIGENLFV